MIAACPKSLDAHFGCFIQLNKTVRPRPWSVLLRSGHHKEIKAKIGIDIDGSRCGADN